MKKLKDISKGAVRCEFHYPQSDGSVRVERADPQEVLYLPLELDALKKEVKDYTEVLLDKRRLTRELDVALFGHGAAKQASLCDLIGPAKEFRDEHSRLREALDRLVKSEVVRTAEFITYSEAYLNAVEVLKSIGSQSTQAVERPACLYCGGFSAVRPREDGELVCDVCCTDSRSPGERTAANSEKKL